MANNENQKMSCDFKMMSFNVRGIQAEKKRNSIFRYIKRKQIDICLLQETHSTLRDENNWKHLWGGDIYFSHGASNARGVMILIKSDLDFKLLDIEKDQEGRYLKISCNIQGTQFKVINLYAPNTEGARLNFFKSMKKKLDRDNDLYQKLIIGGDFNIVRDINMDKRGGNTNLSANWQKINKTLEDIQEGNELQDIWRIKNPDKKRYTWKQNTPKIFCRLDYWLLSTSLNDFVEDADILPSIKSDHSPITLNLKTFENKKGRGYWKLNNTFLEEENYVKSINDLILKLREDEFLFTDKRVLWEYMKFKIREFSIKYGKEKAKTRRDNETEYENKLKKIEENLDKCTDLIEKEQLENQKIDIVNQLKEIDQYKTEGLILRSRCESYEKGEKSNGYFLRLASRNKIKTTMNKLLREDGTVTTRQEEILEMQMKFYKNLYSKHESKSKQEKQNYLKPTKTNRLSEDEKQQCEGLITTDELLKSIKSFKKKKAPGNDGLTAEFYQKFSGLIVQPLRESMNASYTLGKLSTSQRQAVITLLDKGKDRQLIKNWRPISMLNVDYKIVTKSIAERIKKHLPTLIHNNQVGYVKGRQITNNIRTISDIFFYTKSKNIPGILINIDFEKAFDSVDWDFLKEVLKKFNFGNSLIKWIDVFYTDVSSCVINNGLTSEYFSLGRGVRQGDPLSPYIFILVVEILASNIRQDEKIKGIQIGNHQIKVLQYADDTSGIVSDTNSAKQFLKIVETFGTYSGLKLNKSKTEAAWLGSLRNQTLTPLGISWPKNPLRILGVYISYDDNACNKNNFEDRLQKCRQILDSWKSRNLSLLGKTLIIKTFIMSQFLFTTSAIEIPDKYIGSLENSLYEFFWSGRKPKLKRNSLTQTFECGGVNMPDIKYMIKANKIKWVQKYQYSEEHFWKNCFRSVLKDCNIEIDCLLKANYDINLLDLDHYVPTFYINLLRNWAEIGNLNSHMLWYNKNIKINNKSVFYDSFDKIGVKSVSDLFELNGKIIKFEDLENKGLERTEWFKWLGLIKAIKKTKLHLLPHHNQEEEAHLKIEDTDLSKMESQFIYKYFKKKSSTVAGDEFIPRSFKYVTPDQNLKDIFTICHRMVVDTKTKEFQFKFVHDILVNNYWLEKWKVKDSNLCTFCNRAEENSYHLFWNCDYVKEFWTDIKNWLQNKIPIPVTKNNIFYGLKNPLFCTVIFSAKQFIHWCRNNETHPKIQKFKPWVKSLKTKEFHIARKNNTVDIFNEKWQPLMDIE